MDNVALWVVLVVCVLMAGWGGRRLLFQRRSRWIDRFRFPQGVRDKLRTHYPHLSEQEANDVLEGLREYFHLCHTAGRRMVAMPSQAVDVAWHEFILFTRQYAHFCQHALGHFLHHTPAQAMTSPTCAQQGIKLAWKLACRRAGIPPKSPQTVPTLFALDAKLRIPDGFHYALNCRHPGSRDYCAAHIACSASCGGGCSGDSSGCGGGCGGD